ncbi:MAG: amino acid adenylation domain-containing protein, partial [Gammaproteobacteria bacterium]|nr:amino acid adenylation domain-containing protein [Gammaproteobacteria bacterium]
MQEKNKQLRTTQQQSELLIGGRKLEQWSIIDRFEDVVENYADHCAVVSGDSRWTYTQLNEQSNQIARSLIANGVQSEEPVGIALPKSCELIAAVLGVLKAGGAYVPLVDNQPIARLHTMRADAGCRIIIGIDGYLDEIYSDECVKLSVDSCAEFSRKNMESQRSHNQLAYILFTSGSTGTPKGVMIEDAGVIRLVCGQSYLPFSSDFNYLFAAPMSFDVSTLEIFTPLLHGAKLVVLPDGEPNAQVIRDVCHREKVQSTCMAFGLFSSLFESCPEIFDHMPVISVGGEQVNPEIIAQAQKRFPKTQFINAYGPTEATMLATTYAIPSDGRDTQTVLPIGKPLNRMFAYVLNEHLRIVPDGEEGELCLGGVGLARGYLNQDDHTSARFINGPEGCEEKHRLYRTGDLVYKNHDGDFVFVDRIDTQVKIRGYRIELGEIEFAAMEIEEVKQAVAVVLGEGTNQGIGLAIKGDKENIQCGHIRSVLANKLPEYMICLLYTSDAADE